MSNLVLAAWHSPQMQLAKLIYPALSPNIVPKERAGGVRDPQIPWNMSLPQVIEKEKFLDFTGWITSDTPGRNICFAWSLGLPNDEHGFCPHWVLEVTHVSHDPTWYGSAAAPTHGLARNQAGDHVTRAERRALYLLRGQMGLRWLSWWLHFCNLVIFLRTADNNRAKW